MEEAAARDSVKKTNEDKPQVCYIKSVSSVKSSIAKAIVCTM